MIYVADKLCWNNQYHYCVQLQSRTGDSIALEEKDESQKNESITSISQNKTEIQSDQQVVTSDANNKPNKKISELQPGSISEVPDKENLDNTNEPEFEPDGKKSNSKDFPTEDEQIYNKNNEFEAVVSGQIEKAAEVTTNSNTLSTERLNQQIHNVAEESKNLHKKYSAADVDKNKKESSKVLKFMFMSNIKALL